MHHVRKFVRVQKFRDDYGIAAVPKHPDFYAGNFAVSHQRFQLRSQFRARCVVHLLHAHGVLYRERGNGRHAVAAVRREGF